MLAPVHEILAKLGAMNLSDRQAALISYLQEQIAQTLGINTWQLDIQQPLNYMGIDSLIAVKLRNRLRTDLKVDIAAVKFMEDSSITGLATQISEQLTAMTSVSQIPNWDEQELAQTNLSQQEWLEGEL
ncbi:acyl carrier protein [Nostoc sp. FACHB-110]|uniref:acyl carrier protein n=1 Tax=Nostoc sp. FACHB-110 TaxID=2692834 RepID=UPI001686A547|nr:acyl carrier protein [Nostoc sp. FACHB-110]MBD2435677.1 acyl carrier protein [Nostoc sp. FACHB-110]